MIFSVTKLKKYYNLIMTNFLEITKKLSERISNAETYCKKVSKMHIDSIPDWWVQYVIYNVCDMKYSVHVERFGTEKEPLASVICLYEGKTRYDKI